MNTQNYKGWEIKRLSSTLFNKTSFLARKGSKELTSIFENDSNIKALIDLKEIDTSNLQVIWE